ncbi:MAG: phosphosulfolactate synthase [Bacteroidota bacterium]|nr:phosphosulfolactate synthase [Bacteroidota bacterium]
MNFRLPHMPERPAQPRENGLTMVMDKGLSLREAEDLCDISAPYCDLLKLGFGTSIITNRLHEKIRLYKSAGLKPYFGGTLFEAFAVRDMFDDYRRFLDEYEMEVVEVSDGVMELDHDLKCKYISNLSKDYTVLSEVGSKLKGKEISNAKWIAFMQTELQAGSWKVIAEARESGNMGIYNDDGSANFELILDIKKAIDPNVILWEAPLKTQQVWFIKLLGPNVNLGNIATDEIIPLETLRLGLRGDTLLSFLPNKHS